MQGQLENKEMEIVWSRKELNEQKEEFNRKISEKDNSKFSIS